MEYRESNYPKAFAATTVIVAILFALCYLLTIGMPMQQPEGTGGILVNYGTTDEGSGNDISSLEDPSQSEKTSHNRPDKTTPNPTDKSESENSNKNIVTQNTEDAPVVNANDKKPSNTVSTEQKTAPQHVVDQRAIYKGATHTSGNGGGDGTSNKIGNQGSINGSTLSDNYGPGGSGTGLNMPHWGFVSPPDVSNIHRVPGTVVIDFIVDPEGNVLQASSNRQQTRATLDLIQSCIDAIKRTKFHSSTPVTGNTPGQYRWVFKVD
ncbi:hypothetical protein BEL04_15530 [Mucilaginibacter sp. PPCGB 2223]|uniref:energy transducer TonB family protein n=1 Tax=Mucilaginibacter sp. PPCGB 2223 TaxID=1886027 RepID=UPI000824A6BA|nr:energy transducer TonB [Mucilaginibacter sp. PPCGB 2223]OCX51436.1 hypothetical protein BEL04_15530 [Mucilaginibacter sp. PPCGB 2223]